MIKNIFSLFKKKSVEASQDAEVPQYYTHLGVAETELYVDTENDFELVDGLKRVRCAIHGEVVHTKMLASRIDGGTTEILFCPICYAQFCEITFPVFDIDEDP